MWKHDSLWMLRSGYIKEKEDEANSSTSEDEELVLSEDAGLSVRVDDVVNAIPSVRNTAIFGNEVYNHGFEFDVVEIQRRKATGAFYANELVLCCGAVSLSARFKFFQKHITPVALHGFELGSCAKDYKFLSTWENNKVRIMTFQREWTQDVGEWVKTFRSNTTAAKILHRKYGNNSLAEKCLARIFMMVNKVASAFCETMLVRVPWPQLYLSKIQCGGPTFGITKCVTMQPMRANGNTADVAGGRGSVMSL